MKLNFWQWLGVALLILGIYLFVRRDDPKKKLTPDPVKPTPAATQPATPATTTTSPAK